MMLRTLGFLLAAGTAFASAQTPPPATAQVSFRFDRVGLPVPKYSIIVQRDGSAVYAGEEKPFTVVRAGQSSDARAAVATEPFQQSTTLSRATAERIFSLAHSLKSFNTTCASKAKNIADTGAKTLEYRGPEGTASCEYNFSENKDVSQLTTIFLGIAETMDEGRQLEHLHRYDRLGLDAAITTLAQEATDGRALELGTIAPTLRSLVADADVMQRVRMRASKLLSTLPPEQQLAQ
jgi:hypothetical protein